MFCADGTPFKSHTVHGSRFTVPPLVVWCVQVLKIFSNLEDLVLINGELLTELRTPS